jgi:hypothetical protein
MTTITGARASGTSRTSPGTWRGASRSEDERKKKIESREQRAESREQRAESREQGAGSREKDLRAIVWCTRATERLLRGCYASAGLAFAPEQKSSLTFRYLSALSIDRRRRTPPRIALHALHALHALRHKRHATLFHPDPRSSLCIFI